MGALGFQALGRTVGGLDPAPTIGGERMRLHRLQGRKGWRFALLGLTALVFSVFFVAASSGNLTGSTFESTDGNLVKSTGSDWCNAVNGSGVCTSTAPKLVEGQDKAPGSHDDSFANGTKQDDAPCWGLKQSLNSTVADGSLDAGASGTTDPINPGAPRTIGQFRFGEAAINLSDSSILTGCAALGSVYTVSRSSGDSGTATMKDFIAPQKVNIDNCGKIVVKKVTDPSPDATDTSFSFTAGGGLSPTSFSLKNGETKEFPGVNPGNGYNVAETVPSGWDLTSATCDDGSPVTTIDVGAGETVTCPFKAKPRGSVNIQK